LALGSTVPSFNLKAGVSLGLDGLIAHKMLSGQDYPPLTQSRPTIV